MIRHLDGLGESAALIGAVNCVVRRDDGWIGENTDGKGFLSRCGGRRPAGKSVVILGAGGAARAIGVELALAGAALITVVNRGRERGEELVELLNGAPGKASAGRSWQGACDAGRNRHRRQRHLDRPLPRRRRPARSTSTSLSPGMVVADVIPNPPRTRLVREAEARGCTVLDGLGMLVNQGVIGIQHWTGVDPDPAVMRRELEELFGAA